MNQIVCRNDKERAAKMATAFHSSGQVIVWMVDGNGKAFAEKLLTPDQADELALELKQRAHAARTAEGGQ